MSTKSSSDSRKEMSGSAPSRMIHRSSSKLEKTNTTNSNKLPTITHTNTHTNIAAASSSSTTTAAAATNTNTLPDSTNLNPNAIKFLQTIGEKLTKDKDGKEIKKNPFNKAIMGDVFGTSGAGGERSMLGMLYRARVQETVIQKSTLDTDDAAGDKEGDNNSVGAVDMVYSDSESDNDVSHDMNPRQQLAMTIRNWSVIPENDAYIIQEGAVHALIALSSIDDHRIRKCCASALYQISSRQTNRDALVQLGAVTGVITISMTARSLKIAKLCAQTLCNLSMHDGGEYIMARDGAILALVILLGIKGHRLMPICIQALYNLTCVPQHFKGMERIAKAMLNLPPTSFDYSPFLLKVLVNCSRYSWMRLRLIEDGAIAAMVSICSTNNFSTRDNRQLLTDLMIKCLRSLSDSVSCRMDLISKGSVELMMQLSPFCSEETTQVLTKTLHNLLTMPQMGNQVFEVSIALLQGIISKVTYTSNPIALEYCAACMYVVCKQRCRDNQRLFVAVIDMLPKLLGSKHMLTQCYAISATGELFITPSLKVALESDKDTVERLIQCFVEAGMIVFDEASVQALALVLSRLTQDSVYMAVLQRLNLFDKLLELVLKLMKRKDSANIVQESLCSALCRIALNMEGLVAARYQQIADVLIGLLETTDTRVLHNAISSIRALGEIGLCHEELLSDSLLARTANILAMHSNFGEERDTRNETEKSLCRMCCAVLAVFSYDVKSHRGLSIDSVMNVLFSTTRSEDSIIRELVATTLCNISTNVEAREIMIEKGVFEVIGTLSGATSELIQELCAKCICNLTCAVEQHQKMIENQILETILMIALVRSVGSNTKLLCCRALLNLISDNSIEAIKASGAVRVFATLSQINNLDIQLTCAKGFLVYTHGWNRREDLVSRWAVLQALFSMVKCSNSKVRITIGIAVCNLLACPQSQKLCLNAGALSVVKLISSLDFEELREAVVRVIVNLTQVTSIHNILAREPLIPIVLMILQQSTSMFTFECAINALSCMSEYPIFRKQLIDNETVQALVTAVLAGRVLSCDVAFELVRCFFYLSFEIDRARYMISAGNMIWALHVIYKGGLHIASEMGGESTQSETKTDSGVTPASTPELICLIIRNLSEDPSSRSLIMRQEAFKLIYDITMAHFETNENIFKTNLITLHNLSMQEDLHNILIAQKCMNFLYHVSVTNIMGSFDSSGNRIKQINISQMDIIQITKTISWISRTPSCRMAIVEGGLVAICQYLLNGLTSVSRYEMAYALSQCSSEKQCRETLVKLGAADLIITLSSTSSDSYETESQCSLALGYLSGITVVNEGLVFSLLQLSLRAEEQVDAASNNNNSSVVSSDSSLLDPQQQQQQQQQKPANAATNTNNNTLKQMLRDGLVRKGSISNASTADRSSPTFPDQKMKSPLSKLGSNADFDQYSASLNNQNVHFVPGAPISKAKEMEFFKGSFDRFQFKQCVLPSGLETGGISSKLSVDLPLPFVALDRRETTSKGNSQVVVGSCVTRGPDWVLGNDEDGSEGAEGLVSVVSEGTVTVMWPNGKQCTYRYGRQVESQDSEGGGAERGNVGSSSKFIQEVIPVDRNAELTKLPISPDPTDKDTNDAYESIALTYDEIVTKDEDAEPEDDDDNGGEKGRESPLLPTMATLPEFRKERTNTFLVTSKSTNNLKDGNSSPDAITLTDEQRQSLPGGAWKRENSRRSFI